MRVLGYLLLGITGLVLGALLFQFGAMAICGFVIPDGRAAGLEGDHAAPYRFLGGVAGAVVAVLVGRRRV